MHIVLVNDCIIRQLYSTILLGDTSVSLSLSSSLDDTAMLSGDTVRFCDTPVNASLEFLCVAENSTELVWRNTKTEIRNFHIRSKIPLIETVNNGSRSYTVYLDNDTVVNNVTSTFRIVTSRLLVRLLTSLGHNSTDRIECLAYSGTDYIEDTIVINNYEPIGKHLPIGLYIILIQMNSHFVIDSPPKPMLNSQLNISVIGWKSSTLMDDVNITITPDEHFSAIHHVSMYNISVTMLPRDSNITCPMLCNPYDTCICSGVLARSGVNVSISAVSCEDQEGPPLLVRIKSK